MGRPRQPDLVGLKTFGRLSLRGIHARRSPTNFEFHYTSNVIEIGVLRGAWIAGSTIPTA
jgi:hypothetical protein